MNSKGFTLIEVVFSAGLLALALCGILFATVMMRQASQEDFERSQALQDGNRVIEQMRNAAKTGAFPGNVTASFPNNGTVPGFNNLTNEAVTVTYVNSTVNPLDATITITWTMRGTRANAQETLRAVITNRG